MNKTVSVNKLEEIDDLMSVHDREVMEYLRNNIDVVPNMVDHSVHIGLTPWDGEQVCVALGIPNYMAALLVNRLVALGLIKTEYPVDRRVTLRKRRLAITYKGLQMLAYMEESEME